jgi:hypothetical protein
MVITDVPIKETGWYKTKVGILLYFDTETIIDDTSHLYVLKTQQGDKIVYYKTGKPFFYKEDMVLTEYIDSQKHPEYYI